MKSIIFIAGVAVLVMSCTKNNNVAIENGSAGITEKSLSRPDSIVTNRVVYNDSLSVGESKATISIDVEFPVGNSKIAESLDQWISSKMNVPLLWKNAPQEILKAVGDSLIDLAKTDFDGLYDEGWATSYDFQWTCKKIAETPKYVTYSSSLYQYLGGAHGGVAFIAQSFDCSTGQPFGWEIIKSSDLQALTDLVKKKITTDYFEATSANLQDYLLVEADSFPLPANPPYFMNDSVHFDYQQYEIAPYAAGMPECVISVKEIAPMLRESVRKLVE